MDILIFEDSARILDNLKEKIFKFSGKKILLTGAAGFLGTQFIHLFYKMNEYLDSKCELLAIDNFIRGIPEWVLDFKLSPQIRFEKQDVTKLDIRKSRFDYIIHAATIASPKYYRKFPIETMDANVVGIRNILDYSRKYPIESMLFFSTSEIYGSPDGGNIPTRENYNGNVSCTGPRSCYDESKRYSETLCKYFYEVYNVPVKIVRPFNNYGPGLKIDDERVIPDFFKNIIAEEDILIYSDGSPTRTFSYISDAMTGYLLALLSEYDGEAFNIGIDKPEISMIELAKLIIDVSGKANSIKLTESNDKNYLIDNPLRRCPSIEKAKKLLGYNPKVDLVEGLNYTYNWYLSKLG